jgi:hypothetical protein
MKILRFGVTMALLLAFASSAMAHPPYHRPYPRSSVSLGFYFGDPWFPYYPYPPYPPYPPRVYMPAPIIVTPPAPPVYIEQQPAPSTGGPLEAGYWYYCEEAKAYYPYVKQCPGGWQRVAPQPQQ